MRIPVSIVTGFLGSGKTTLIGRLLRDPRFARTAVIVNEFGEVGLDHDLIASGDETLLTLTTGCLCCAIRSDLVATLLELQARREAGDIAFDRVAIETSGLADPAPILQALMTDADVARFYCLGTVLTVVDALHGEAALERHAEAWRQAALADRIALSKTDLAGPADVLQEKLAAVNPSAPLRPAGGVEPDWLFSASGSDQRVARLAALPAPRAAVFPRHAALHSDGVTSFVLQRDTPLPALALTLLLQALAEHCGARLLRVKGLVNIAEMPGQPALIHGVQHVFAAPDFLPRWPTDDHSTRLVFITQGVPPHFPARLLAAIEAEVLEASAVIPS